MRHKDKIAADLVLARIARKREGERRAYPCRHCGGWHTTKQEKRA